MLTAAPLGACYGNFVETPAIAAATSESPLPAPRTIAPPETSSIVEPSLRRGVAFKDETAPYVEGLTLGEAVRRALRFSPMVQAAALEIDAKQAESLQAGLRPNPELDATLQDVNGCCPTVELSQVFELGGKRLKRLHAAELDAGVAAWDYEAARLRVASNTAQAFVDVLASQERIKILEELQAVAGQLSSTVAERVQDGSASPVDVERANIEVTRAKVQSNEEKALLEVAKHRLANFWGAQNIDFGSAKGEFTTTDHVPSVGEIRNYLSSNPDIARWAAEMARREAVLNLAHANRIPDLKLGAGAMRNGDETGATVSVSIPLPIFNRNQGNIEAAETRIYKGERESLAASIDVNSTFLEAYGRLVMSAERLKGLEKEILPAAQQVHDATTKGYLAGKFDLLNVFDAQRTLFSTRLEIINARAEFQKAKVQIEALIGRALAGV
jgi:cobalt-zinc-cadmium efflux system outer membrane protein